MINVPYKVHILQVGVLLSCIRSAGIAIISLMMTLLVGDGLAPTTHSISRQVTISTNPLSCDQYLFNFGLAI